MLHVGAMHQALIGSPHFAMLECLRQVTRPEFTDASKEDFTYRRLRDDTASSKERLYKSPTGF